MDDPKFALLIDADNISAKYIVGILDEMARYGVATYRRIYGDWTSTQASKWKDELLGNSITPIQQFSNTTGKNATDSALIIDAMDILYAGGVDGFCIVSSDSDFTRLASRLRESGMVVVGMGEEKTPLSFRNACTKFVNLENLTSEHEEESEDGAISQGAIEDVIAGIITENTNKGRTTDLAEIGNRLSNKYPDFDVRNFGYSYLSKFIEEMDRFESTKVGSTVSVAIRESTTSLEEVVDFVKRNIKGKSRNAMSLSELGNLVHTEFPDFNIKDHGYAQFHKFLQGIGGIKVIEDASGRKRAKM